MDTIAVRANLKSIQNFKLSASDGLLWLVVLLSPFQDTALQKTPLKLVGASLSFLPLIALFVLAAIKRFYVSPFSVGRTTLAATVYAFLVCVANVVWVNKGEVFISLHSWQAYVLLTSVLFFTIFGIEYRRGRHLHIAVYLSFLLTIVGIICGQLLGPNAIPFLQATPSLSGRPHGFCTEPSTLSVQIVASGLLTAHFLSRPWQKWGAGLLTGGLLIFSSSKGGLISLLLCALVLGLARSRSSFRSKIFAGIIVLPLLFFGSLFIISMFGTLVELNETSTIATRLSMAVYAFIAVAHNPFGVGFTGFLPSIPHYLPQAMDFVQHLFPFPLFFGEVKEYLEPPQTNADCKTFFFDFFVFFGIPFAIMYFRFLGRLLKALFRIQSNWLFVAVLFSAIATMTYYSTMNAWTLPLLFGIALDEIKQHENSVRLH